MCHLSQRAYNLMAFQSGWPYFLCVLWIFKPLEGKRKARERKEEATPVRGQCSIGVETLALDVELNLHGDLPLS